MDLSDLTGAQDHFLCMGNSVIAIGLNKQKRPGHLCGCAGRFHTPEAYCTFTARLSLIFCCQIAGPVMCTDSPLLSTATVTGMSLTSNS